MRPDQTVVVLHPVSARAAAGLPAGDCLRDHAPDAPILGAQDRGVLRGDGIFESLSALGTRPADLDLHLHRLQRSARRMDLPELAEPVIEAGVRRALELLGETGRVAVRVVVTRGPEGAQEPTAWVSAAPAADHSRARREGVRAVLLDRGLRSDAGQSSPWLLTGVKSLSYAIHAAAAREAQRRGADEAIFVSTDGFVLEGTTASVLARRGGRTITPPEEHGILAGTTLQRAAALLEAAGVLLEHRPLPVAELEQCDALWLLSSGRRAVPIVEVDGRRVPIDRELTDLLDRGLERPDD